MFRWKPLFVLGHGLALASCGEVVKKSPDAGSDDLCAMVSCDDGNACTTDTCNAGSCTHEPAHGQQVFMPTGQIQMFGPDACARTITIDAFGAQGGTSMMASQAGGLGAHVKGDFSITAGEVLMVLVGGRGGSSLRVAGGGGGTFVWNFNSPALPYVVAGGGGGAGINSPGGPGLITESGGNGVGTTGGGGVNGSGGVTPSPLTNWAAGGGGWVSDGEGGGGPVVMQQACTLAAGGKAPRNGGAGGAAGGAAVAASGGFGGGGGGQGQCNATGGGGGGGYSGGGAGIDNGAPNFTGGGGGGSYNTGMNPLNEPGVRTGAGQVTISW